MMLVFPYACAISRLILTTKVSSVHHISHGLDELASALINDQLSENIETTCRNEDTMQRRDLVAGWSFKQRDPAKTVEEDCAIEEGWLPASVPGVVQGDLLALGLIPDP